MSAIARIHSVHALPVAATGPAAWSRPARLNITLFVVALVALLYYVMQVNILAATAWQIKDARERLGTLTDDHAALIARVAELEDRSVLQDLARESGFVPAESVVYLIQPSAVAAVP